MYHKQKQTCETHASFSSCWQQPWLKSQSFYPLSSMVSFRVSVSRSVKWEVRPTTLGCRAEVHGVGSVPGVQLALLN